MHKYLRRICTVCIIATASLLLLGCGGGSDDEGTQKVTFDDFSLEITQAFTPVPSGLIENRQIINKILRSYKIPNEAGFDKNLVVTKSSIDPGLNHEDFTTANQQKLNRELVGYQPVSKQQQDFTCNGEEIDGVVTSFTVTDTFYEDIDTYYIFQYQFVANGVGYIVSFATDQQDDEMVFQNIVKSLQCNGLQ